MSQVTVCFGMKRDTASDSSCQPCVNTCGAGFSLQSVKSATEEVGEVGDPSHRNQECFPHSSRLCSGEDQNGWGGQGGGEGNGSCGGGGGACRGGDGGGLQCWVW